MQQSACVIARAEGSARSSSHTIIHSAILWVALFAAAFFIRPTMRSTMDSGVLPRRAAVDEQGAPLPKLNFAVTAEGLLALTRETLASSVALVDRIVAAFPPLAAEAPSGGCTFATAVAPLARMEAHVSTVLAAAYFLQYVSTDDALRAASVEAKKLMNQYHIDLGMREDLFKVVRAVHEAAGSGAALEGEERRFLDKMLLAFKHNGMYLGAAERTLLKEKRNRLASLAVEFSQNMNEDKTTLVFTADELAGCPPDFLEGLARTSRPSCLAAAQEGAVSEAADAAADGQENYILTMKYPDVFGILKRATREDVRRRMDVAFNTKCAALNGPILSEAILLRSQCARLLGYDSHAAFQLEDRLASSVHAVEAFEKDLVGKVTPLALKEIAKLKELKTSMALQLLGGSAHKDEEDGQPSFGTWDVQYYARHILESEYAIDDEKLKEYYSLSMVIPEMLRIYEQVLGLVFIPVDLSAAKGEEAANFSGTAGLSWHPDVLLYKVCNRPAADGEPSGDAASLVGHVYLDLHPREGKYTHAACFVLQPGCQVGVAPGGEEEDILAYDPKSSTGLPVQTARQHPVSAIVANFPKPSATKPSLIPHSDVVTLFHELGHAMHGMCALTKFSRFHGTNVETDFVEAPSQMLENWCWNGRMLKRISRHYLRPEETLSDELIAQLVRAKNFNVGIHLLRQIFFGTFDMAIHSFSATLAESQADLDRIQGARSGEALRLAVLGNKSIDEVYAEMRLAIAIVPQAAGVSPVASFGHMMGGYDAGYYSYLWSEVFSADMFASRFEAPAPPAADGLEGAGGAGADYRRFILAPGGSRDAHLMLVDFLGRKPNSDAFMRSIGL